MIKMTVEYFAKSLTSGRYYAVLSDKFGNNKKITDGLLFWNGTYNVLEDLTPVDKKEVPASVMRSLSAFAK